MTSNSKNSKIIISLLFILTVVVSGYAQDEKDEWKMQISLGVNNPIDSNDNDSYYTKYINFPAVNLGVQHMFTRTLGAKLDFGYYRSSNDDSSSEFKLNYSRINTQVVYDASPALNFLPLSLEVIAHAGPGLSFTSPLGSYSNNKYAYLNALAGIEVHYLISDTLSIYSDLGYILGLSSKEKYDSNIDGFSFNGDLMYLTFGVSVSLSGCQTCN